jgi:hypothetical protein
MSMQFDSGNVGAQADGYLGLDGEPITLLQWAKYHDQIPASRLLTWLENDPATRVVTEWTGIDPTRSSGGCPWEVREESGHPDPEGVIWRSYVRIRARTRQDAISAHWHTVKQVEWERSVRRTNHVARCAGAQNTSTGPARAAR